MRHLLFLMEVLTGGMYGGGIGVLNRYPKKEHTDQGSPQVTQRVSLEPEGHERNLQ